MIVTVVLFFFFAVVTYLTFQYKEGFLLVGFDLLKLFSHTRSTVLLLFSFSKRLFFGIAVFLRQHATPRHLVSDRLDVTPDVTALPSSPGVTSLQNILLLLYFTTTLYWFRVTLLIFSLFTITIFYYYYIFHLTKEKAHACPPDQQPLAFLFLSFSLHTQACPSTPSRLPLYLSSCCCCPTRVCTSTALYRYPPLIEGGSVRFGLLHATAIKDISIEECNV
eukprot:gene9275-6520_t